MDQLNPSEITALIKERIEHFEPAVEERNVGTVVSVSDGIVRVHGLGAVQYGEMIEFEGGNFGLALNLERDSVGAVVFGDYVHIGEGSTVKTTGRILEVTVGEALLEEAVVHDNFDAGGLGFGGGFLVDDAFLQPEVGDLEADDFVDDGGDVLGTTEDVDELNFAGMGGRGGSEVREGGFSERGQDAGIDGKDAIALALDETRDSITGAAFVVGEADDGDGFGAVEDFLDGFGFVQGNGSCTHDARKREELRGVAG